MPSRTIILHHRSPPVFQCLCCELLLSDQCADCERAHSILKTGDDPIASSELARWIGGELSQPEHGSDPLLEFAEKENIAHLAALLDGKHIPTNAKW